MPTYEYRCAKCGQHVEVFQSFTEKPLTKHAGCGGKLAKVLSPAGIVLKGSGFYKTDNRSGGKKRTAASDGKGGDTKATETKSADTKPAASESSNASTSGSGASASSSDAKSA
jgi:putative FmdB family regulatory protein